MSYSPQMHDKGAEDVLLNPMPGTADNQNNNTCSQVVVEKEAASCCNDKHHRKLAICSIICGLSCIGIQALIYSVKAKTTEDTRKAAEFSKQAKKFSIISIVTWVAILVLTPLLMGLISYLLTLRD